MANIEKQPRRATSTALECDQLAGQIDIINSHNAYEIQLLRERFICERFEHISRPTARVVAGLAFGGGAA